LPKSLRSLWKLCSEILLSAGAAIGATVGAAIGATLGAAIGATLGAAIGASSKGSFC